MLYLITGPNDSGKSAYAEAWVKQYADFAAPRPVDRLLYLATMVPQTPENDRRIEAHRRQRAGLGFVTVEEPVSLARVPVQPGDVVLLEDVSNLLANVLFCPESLLNPDGLSNPDSLFGPGGPNSPNSPNSLLNSNSLNGLFGLLNPDGPDGLLNPDGLNGPNGPESETQRALRVLADILALADRCQCLVAVTIAGLSEADYTGETAAYIRALNALNHALADRADGVLRMNNGQPHPEKGDWYAVF